MPPNVPQCTGDPFPVSRVTHYCAETESRSKKREPASHKLRASCSEQLYLGPPKAAVVPNALQCVNGKKN